MMGVRIQIHIMMDARIQIHIMIDARIQIHGFRCMDSDPHHDGCPDSDPSHGGALVSQICVTDLIRILTSFLHKDSFTVCPRSVLYSKMFQYKMGQDLLYIQ